jgi:predicted dehydrogenase
VNSPELFFWPRIADSRSGALVAELQHFAECSARNEESSRVPLSDVLAVMSVGQAAMDAIETGRPQQVRHQQRRTRDEEPYRG